MNGSLYSLKEIDLGDCFLETQGTITLINALKVEHFGLERLTLEYNQITTNASSHIALALKNKKQLQLLNLNGNKVSQF